jgi:hypothetical protein
LKKVRLICNENGKLVFVYFPAAFFHPLFMNRFSLLHYNATCVPYLDTLSKNNYIILYLLVIFPVTLSGNEGASRIMGNFYPALFFEGQGMRVKYTHPIESFYFSRGNALRDPAIRTREQPPFPGNEPQTHLPFARILHKH